MDCKSSSSSLYTNLYESRNNTKNNHRNSHSHKSLEYYHPCSIENAEESNVEEIHPVKLHRTHIIRANQVMNNIKHKEAIENIIQSYKKYGLLV